MNGLKLSDLPQNNNKLTYCRECRSLPCEIYGACKFTVTWISQFNRHAVILHRLFSFLTAFSTLVLKHSFSRSLSLHLSLPQAYLLEFDFVWQ